MRQVELNTELTSNLPFVFLIPDLLLLHHFHTTEETCLLVLNKHDLPELTLTQFLTYNKIVSLKVNRLFNFHLFHGICDEILFKLLISRRFLKCEINLCLCCLLESVCCKLCLDLLCELLLLEHTPFFWLLDI